MGRDVSSLSDIPTKLIRLLGTVVSSFSEVRGGAWPKIVWVFWGDEKSDWLLRVYNKKFTRILTLFVQMMEIVMDKTI